jgi:hypothetical protein
VRKIYTAANPIQAHVLRGALEAAGIDAEVRGDYLFSTRGESPVTVETLPSVWIRDDADYEAARAIVAELERRPANGPVGTWKCACGEVCEDTFDACWKCGARRGLNVT